MPPASDTYNVNITSLAASGAATIDARNALAVVVRAGAGATVTCSAVDTLAATSHNTGGENAADVAAGSFANLFALLGPHPFYRVSSAGGAARVVVIL